MSNSQNALRGALGCLTAMSLVLALPGIADAQVRGGQAPPATAANETTSPSAETLGNLPPVVFLADNTPRCKAKTREDMEDCEQPRAARPSTIASDTPMYGPQAYLARYPNSGIQGYMRIANDNRELCTFMNESLANINNLDQLFAAADAEYDVLQDIYNSLPADVKRTTWIMTITQAVQTGALCVLSAGTYCIAAIANGAGNIASVWTSRGMQLANIRLSIANIVVTKLNIYSNRLTLRFDAWWVMWYSRGCDKLGYKMSVTMVRMPPLPAVPDRFGVRR